MKGNRGSRLIVGIGSLEMRLCRYSYAKLPQLLSIFGLRLDKGFYEF